MNELKWFVWMLPLLFIIHDMEEIVTAKRWCRKGLTQHIPLPITPFGNTKSSSGMSVAVYEELLLLLFVTMIGNMTGFYGLWYGMFIANIVHLILLHIIFMPLSYRHYVPGEITAWLTLLPCCYIMKLAQKVLAYSPAEIILWTTVGIIIAFINLKILHKHIPQFEKMTA